MRLVSLARFRYGLRWPGNLPRIQWRNWLDGLLLVLLLVIFYAGVALIDQTARSNDAAARAEYQRAHAERALVACLNGGAIMAGDNTAIFCNTITHRL